MHPNTGDIWYAKSEGNVRNYHSKRNAPNTRHLWVDKTTSKGPQKKKSVAQNTPHKYHMGHEMKKRGPYYSMGDEKFRGPSTIWATKRKNAAHIIVWATKNFVALVHYGPRNEKTRPILSFGRRNFSWP